MSRVIKDWITDKPQKAEVTRALYDNPEGKISVGAMIMPGNNRRDIQFGMASSLFIPGTTNINVVEKKVRLANMIHNDMVDMGFATTTYAKELTDINLRKDPPDFLLDYTYLDTCSIYTYRLHNWLPSLTPYIALNGEFAITLVDRANPYSWWYQVRETHKKYGIPLPFKSHLDFIERQITIALGREFQRLPSKKYFDTCSMFLLRFQKRNGTMARNRNSITFTATQQVVYDSLTPSNKAAFTKALRSTNSAGLKSAITKKFQTRTS